MKKHNLEIENTGEIQVREFATDGNTLYATSSQGYLNTKMELLLHMSSKT